MNREKIGSRLGFIMLSAGCAIGCGNVWKFPWMVGQNGGGAFVLLYALCLLLLGIPVMTMEFAMGRAAQASPVRMYQALTPTKKVWHLHGYVALFGNICLYLPVGFLLAPAAERCKRFRDVLLFTAALSCVIEILQYFIGRSADIDDVFLQLLGAAIGYGIWRTIVKLTKQEEKHQSQMDDQVYA